MLTATATDNAIFADMDTDAEGYMNEGFLSDGGDACEIYWDELDECDLAP